MKATYSKITRIKRNKIVERNNIIKQYNDNINRFVIHEADMVKTAMTLRDIVANSIIQITNVIPKITVRIDPMDDLEITVTEKFNYNSYMMLQNEFLFNVLSEEISKNIKMQAKELMLKKWRNLK